MEPEIYSTGAKRNSATGKGAFELLPPKALRLLAEHFERGAGAHGARNWEKGIPLQRIFQSALRHSFDYLEGKANEDHALSAFWNWAVFIETRERIKAGYLPKELNNFLEVPLHKINKNKLVRDFAAVDEKFFKSCEWQKVDNGKGEKRWITQEEFLYPSAYTQKDHPPILQKANVKDFNRWVDSKEFWPNDLISFQIEYTSHETKLGRCYSNDFKRGIFEPIFWRYIKNELNDGSFVATYTKFNKKEIAPDCEEKARFLRIDDEFQDDYAEFKGMTLEKLKVHPIYKVLAPILAQPEKAVATDLAAKPINMQVIEWINIHEIPQLNRILLLKYNVKHLKQFSPHFPVAEYAIGYANNIDQTLYTHWAYLSKPFDQDQIKADKALDQVIKNKESNLVVPSGYRPFQYKHALPAKKEVLACTSQDGEIKQAIHEIKVKNSWFPSIIHTPFKMFTTKDYIFVNDVAADFIGNDPVGKALSFDDPDFQTIWKNYQYWRYDN